MADSRKLVELHVQFAPYFELGEDESECRPECKPDVTCGELISRLAENFLPKKFPVEFLRFCKNKKVIKNDTTIGQAFKKKGINKATLEINGAIKLNLCAKRDIWLPYTSNIKTLKDLRQIVEYKDVKGIHKNIDQNNY